VVDSSLVAVDEKQREKMPEHGEYHEYYLQRNGIEFVTTIVFEDGMDYEECELYYASLNSQTVGGIVHPVKSRQPSGSRRTRTSPRLDGALPIRSCLRKSRFTSSQAERRPRRALIRRCSFSGTPKQSVARNTPSRTKSSCLEFHAGKPRVAFEPSVRVTTIHSAIDLPDDIRMRCWMTREEMTINIRRAALEDLQEKRRCLREEQLDALFGPDQEEEDRYNTECFDSVLTFEPESQTETTTTPELIIKHGGCVERKTSVDCVIDECMQSVQVSASA